MSVFKSNIDPAGRQKVYFCCHPDDYERYYDLIREDIIKSNDNCAIFYESDPYSDFDEQELRLRLDAMDLFVVPVSAVFLTESSRAYSFDLDHAIKTHIPVLPIAVETDIVDRFNSSGLLGGLQYIDRTSTDVTEIAYGEKVKRFLDNVLVSDELAKRIRAEFAAGMFLSYRKKDRAFAQDLMRRVRTNEFCRDVAIWYDEYLVPGESFEAHIQDSMTACDTVLMNVTPSLLEPGNYVAVEEYPCANQRLRKPIVAAETVNTDKAELESMYPGISSVLVSGSDDASLRKALREALVEKAGKERLLHPDNSADHLYYMGLAYKNRIDVEVDADKAVELLTEAYTKGHSKAAAELARMYRNGDRVSRDSGTSIIWYDRYISQLEKAGSKDFSTCFDTMTALMEKGELQQSLGLLGGAEDTYGKCLDLCVATASQYGGFLEYMRIIALYDRLGVIASGRGDISAAERYAGGLLDACKWFEDDIDVIVFPENVKPDSITANICYDRMFACQRLGDISRDKGDLVKAEEYYQQMIEASRSLAATDSGRKIDNEGLNQLAIGYDRLGDICRVRGELSEAGEYYREAYDIRLELAKNHDRTEYKRNLSMSHTRLGYIFRMRGVADAAERHYSRAVKISEELADGSDDVQLLDDLALAYYNYGLLTEDASYYVKARDIWRRISDKTGVGRYRERYDMAIGSMNDAIMDHVRQADSAERADDAGGAEKHYKCIADICRMSLENEESDAKRHNAAIAYERLGNIALLRKDTAAAEEYFLQLVSILEPVAETTGMTDNRRELAVGYDRLSGVYESFGDHSKARDCIHKAIDIFERYSDLAGLAGSKSELAYLQYRAASLHE